MSERTDILAVALDSAFAVVDKSSYGEFAIEDERVMLKFANFYDISENSSCDPILNVELESCTQDFVFDERYIFDVQTIEDNQTMYRAGYYTLKTGASTYRAVPSTYQEIVSDIESTNPGKYFEITGGRPAATTPGGISIAHTASDEIACHVFLEAAGLINGVKDITGTAMTPIDQVFINVTINIPSVDTTLWDIFLINKIIAPGTYKYSMY